VRRRPRESHNLAATPAGITQPWGDARGDHPAARPVILASVAQGRHRSRDPRECRPGGRPP